MNRVYEALVPRVEEFAGTLRHDLRAATESGMPAVDRFLEGMYKALGVYSQFKDKPAGLREKSGNQESELDAARARLKAYVDKHRGGMFNVHDAAKESGMNVTQAAAYLRDNLHEWKVTREDTGQYRAHRTHSANYFRKLVRKHVKDGTYDAQSLSAETGLSTRALGGIKAYLARSGAFKGRK